MKKGILLLLLISSVFAQAQSLKEALFSGKLKNRPGTVVRKGDDLTQKMDTASKIAIADSGIVKTEPPIVDTVATKDTVTARSAAPVDSAAIVTTDNKKDTGLGVVEATAMGVTANAVTEVAAAPKSNTVLWKEYMDGVANALKTEVLPSKKIKRDIYYVTVSYTIGTDGQVTIGDIILSPENSFLLQQIKDRVAMDPPRLSPVLSSTGTPRKVSKKYNFNLTKD